MPRIIEGRRRGRGVGTSGIVLGGYQRRDNDDNLHWPEPHQSSSNSGKQQQELPQQQLAAGQSLSTTEGTASSTTPSPSSLMTQDEEVKKALIEDAKRAFQKRRPRKKKRTVLSSTGELVDDGFSFGGKGSSCSKKKTKPRAKSSLSPPVISNNNDNNNSDRDHLPMITPAGSIISVAEQNELVSSSARQSPLAWQSPHPHAPSDHQHPSSVHHQQDHQKQQQSVNHDQQKDDLEALMEQHRREMLKQQRKHELELQEQQRRHSQEQKALNDKCQENNMKILDLQSKIKEKDEQHAASLKKAVEIERIRITSLWEKDKKNHQLQVMSMQQQFNQCQQGDKQQHQLAAEEERRGALERATTFFSKREDPLTALDQYPILKQLTSTCASSGVKEQSVKKEGEMKTEERKNCDDTTADAAASVLLELNNNVPVKQETTCTEVAEVPAETRASRAKNNKAVGESKKTTEKGGQHQQRRPSHARGTPQPPSRRSPRNHGKRLRVPKPNLQELLDGVPLPAFTVPENLNMEPKAKRRKTRRTKVV